MAPDEQGPNHWVVTFGGDSVKLERTSTGLFALAMPERREAIGTRAEVQTLRKALDILLDQDRRQQ